MITSLSTVTKIKYQTEKEEEKQRIRISLQIQNKLRQSRSTFKFLSILLDSRQVDLVQHYILKKYQNDQKHLLKIPEYPETLAREKENDQIAYDQGITAQDENDYLVNL